MWVISLLLITPPLNPIPIKRKVLGELMNLMDELKLMIYESNLDEEERNLCLEAVEECTTEDEFFETANDVLCLMEGNAYNKIANKYKNAYDYHLNKMSAFKDAGLDKQAEKAFDQAMDAYHSASKKDIQDLDDYNPRGSILSIRPDAQNAENRDYKQMWMRRHGNKGTSPEEKYKAGRYLELQNKINKLKKQYKQK